MSSLFQQFNERTRRLLYNANDMLKSFPRFLSHARFKNLSVIEDHQLIDLLQRSHQWEALQKGMLYCTSCGAQLSMNNVAGFSKQAGSYRFFCDGLGCSSTLVSETK
jgi:hypothetical protein